MTTTTDPPDDETPECEDSTVDMAASDETTVDSSAVVDAAKTPKSVRSKKLPSDKCVAVVTGAARRVGREIALAMAERGLAVVVHHGTSTVEANVLVNRIRSQGGAALAVSADLRDPRAAAMAVFEAAAELGEVTTLINSRRVSKPRIAVGGSIPLQCSLIRKSAGADFPGSAVHPTTRGRPARPHHQYP
ncbi:MAG: SDR family NAD(P)-dependent oxidoreductase [Planctomycetaceae bacterium]